MAIFRAKSSDSFLSSSPVQTLTAVRYISRISAFLVCEGREERNVSPHKHLDSSYIQSINKAVRYEDFDLFEKNSQDWPIFELIGMGD
ncbi:hypothetical protein KIN20_010287 [Parelaphostrongylus tenuis]|uniref:Uncharacterized protein n=1 Tax=Parelaphostrongylus tenuis TaxID=148309 RepID=A0AAD5MYW7_PARTN|nr:hypothetical protein KIN20_010287 [Parelaphostrongylus tenuis]